MSAPECETKCAYGECGAPRTMLGCGGCCGCLGGCQVEYEAADRADYDEAIEHWAASDLAR